MEPKKNPKKDLNKNSSVYFVLGLVLVMLLAFVALEWKTYEPDSIYDISLNVTENEIKEEPVEKFKIETPPQQKLIPPEIKIEEDNTEIEETEILSTEADTDTKVLEVDDIVVDEIPDDVSVPFSVIEDVPIFPGCENENDKRACFQKMISKHIVKNFRYPEITQEMGIQGKVNIMFVIQKDGSIGDIQLRGPDKNLEKEAARILSKLPKMIPGKQRGKAVKVSFAQPITFKLP